MRALSVSAAFVALSVVVGCSPEQSRESSWSGSGGATGSGGSTGLGGSAEDGAGSPGNGPAGPASSGGSNPTSAGQGAGPSTSGGDGGSPGDGGGGSGEGGAPDEGCPGGFACNDGACISFAWFCDGEDDCSDGQDEGADTCQGFIDSLGVCHSGIAFEDNPGRNLCAGAECCEPFEACSDGGSDIESCVGCFEEGGGALCDAALDCMVDQCNDASSGVCDTTLTFYDLEYDACLTDRCCEDFQACVGDGSQSDIDDCIDCFIDGKGALCDAAIECAADDCPADGEPAGICDSGLTSGDESDDVCLTDACCAAFTACTSSGSNVDACVDCLTGGGGALCNDAVACADDECP